MQNRPVKDITRGGKVKDGCGEGGRARNDGKWKGKLRGIKKRIGYRLLL